jgi:hypothetical protein
VRKLDYYKRFTYIPNEVYEHLKGLEDAAGGDVDLVILPAMTGTPAVGPALEPTVSEANDDYVATVILKIMDKAKTKVLEWFNGTLEVDIIPSSSSGTIAVNDDETPSDTTVTKNMTFENGVCEFTVTLGGTWAENDTIKVTVDDDNVGIMGYTVEKNNHFLVEVQADPT